MKNIILTGFMGTGKSSVGRLLSQRLSYRFVDTDELIEKDTGLSITDIFRDFGEAHFRSLEKAVIKKLCKEEGFVIATGGGAIIDPENLKLLKKNGILVCLTASPETIYRRVAGSNKRPLLKGENKVEVIERLLREREGFYKKADVVIDTTRMHINEVVEEVIKQVGLRRQPFSAKDIEGEASGFIEVGLGERCYPIYFFSNGFHRIGEVLKKHGLYKRVAIITNPTIRKLYGEKVLFSLKDSGFEPVVIEVPDGERFKTLRWVSKIYDELLRHRMGRESPLVALGGGVIGDITGFAAATYLRGVPYVQIPTTLLAQVDSSVGGKTGVNHPSGKNLIGAFYQPEFVFIDVGFLNTLKQREFRAGLAEVAKYGVIKDASLFSYLKDNIERILALEEGPLLYIIKRSCEIKARIVEEDEREKGIRAILNFGHTFGHAIESITSYRKFRHGEAVSIGMVLASRLSEKLGLCSIEVTKEIKLLLSKIGLPVEPPSLAPEAILNTIKFDKKVLRENLRLVLVKEIGEVFIKERNWEDFSLDLKSILK